MAVEGKAGELFGPTIDEWLTDSSDGKRDRLAFLCEALQTKLDPPRHLRYQLFHRTVSAILEARRCHAGIAIVMVQSFHTDDLQRRKGQAVAWDDYFAFVSHLGAVAARGRLADAQRQGYIKLFLGWVDCDPVSDAAIAKVL
jgi:hypothetical protein